VARASEWQIDANGNPADVDLNYTGVPLTVPVGPGQSVYVQFTLAPVSVSTNLVAQVNSPNSLTLTYAGLPNYPYHVQMSSNITLAPAQWQNLVGRSNNASSGGLFTFTDTNSASFNPRFYRVVTS